jgi:hypothetical protein
MSVKAGQAHNVRSVCASERGAGKLNRHLTGGTEPEHDDLAEKVATAFVRVGEVVVDEIELAEVGHHGAGGEEPLKSSAIGGVVEDRLVALHEALVAGLTLADIVEQPIAVPAVVIAVAMTFDRISEEQDHRSLRGRADATLLPAPEPCVQVAAGEPTTRGQLIQHVYLRFLGSRTRLNVAADRGLDLR